MFITPIKRAVDPVDENQANVARKILEGTESANRKQEPVKYSTIEDQQRILVQQNGFVQIKALGNSRFQSGTQSNFNVISAASNQANPNLQASYPNNNQVNAVQPAATAVNPAAAGRSSRGAGATSKRGGKKSFQIKGQAIQPAAQTGTQLSLPIQ